MSNKIENAAKTFSRLPRTQEEIVSVLDLKTRALIKEISETPCHSLPYYNGLLRLLNHVILEVKTRNIFPAPDGWYYSFTVFNTEADLFIRHVKSMEETEDEGTASTTIEYDESFRLISYPVNLLSVEEYAKLNKIEAVTVRQWIRRGKLRTAVKLGGEWRIPEITDTPARGYTSVRYYNDGRFFPLPQSYKCLEQNPLYIDIYPSKEKKGFCQIFLDGIPAKLSGELIPDVEREKIELALISTPGMRSSATTIMGMSGIRETDSRGPKIRTGRARLPLGWDPNLYGRKI